MLLAVLVDVVGLFDFGVQVHVLTHYPREFGRGFVGFCAWLVAGGLQPVRRLVRAVRTALVSHQ